MYFNKTTNKKVKPKNYTLMLIPNKYGSSKAINISRKFIIVLNLFFILIITSIVILYMDYIHIKRENSKNIKIIEELEAANEKKRLEIESYKRDENNIKDTIKKLKNLEELMYKKFNLKSYQNKKTNYTSNINIDELLKYADTEINNINSSINIIDKHNKSLNAIPSILPCIGKITSYYGSRKDPIARGHLEFHTGIDISNSYGTKIYACADGIVEFSGLSSGYGKLIIINHNNGYKTYYGHNSKLLVKEGQIVKKGQIISLMGSTGRSTGSHVHFEIRKNNIPINPLKFLKERSF